MRVRFTLTTDPSRKLVRARMSGFLTPDEIMEFSRQEQDAVRAMGLGSGEFLLLIDTSDTVIQSQETVATFMRIFMRIVADSPLEAGRIAVARGSSITRLQTQRILSIRDSAAIFQTRAEAEDRLFGKARAA